MPSGKVLLVSNGGGFPLRQLLGVANLLKEPYYTLDIAVPLGASSLLPNFSSGIEIPPPFPRLVIGSTQETIATCLKVKKSSLGKTPIVLLQHPGKWAKDFDLFVSPEHQLHPSGWLEGLVGSQRTASPNGVITKALIHSVTPELLAQHERTSLGEIKLGHRKNLLLILGNPSSRALYSPTHVGEAMQAMLDLVQGGNLNLLVYVSSTTPPEFRRRLSEMYARNADLPVHFFHEHESPYFALLQKADYFVITADKTDSISEALATGKPVYSLFELGAKWDLQRFHKTLGTMGYIRGFRGTLAPWQYRPLSELKSLVLPRLKALLQPKPVGKTGPKGTNASGKHTAAIP